MRIVPVFAEGDPDAGYDYEGPKCFFGFDRLALLHLLAVAEIGSRFCEVRGSG